MKLNEGKDVSSNLLKEIEKIWDEIQIIKYAIEAHKTAFNNLHNRVLDVEGRECWRNQEHFTKVGRK